MADRDMSPDAREQWSQRNQTLRHSGVRRPGDDDALLHDPDDYSALGGPEDEPAYGRTRSDDGHYPFGPLSDSYDRDGRADMQERGGYVKQKFSQRHSGGPTPSWPS